MTAGELIKILRVDLNDTSAIEYSDSELLEYINRALEWINQELIALGSHYVIKKTTLTLTNNVSPLPSDFVEEYAVVSNGITFESIPPHETLRDYTYKIYGGKIEAKADTIDLYYYYSFPALSSTQDEIPLPQSLMNLLKYLVLYMAKSRIELPTKLEASIIQDVKRKLQSFAEMGINNITMVVPFRI